MAQNVPANLYRYLLIDFLQLNSCELCKKTSMLKLYCFETCHFSMFQKVRYFAKLIMSRMQFYLEWLSTLWVWTISFEFGELVRIVNKQLTVLTLDGNPYMTNAMHSYVWNEMAIQVAAYVLVDKSSNFKAHDIIRR